MIITKNVTWAHVPLSRPLTVRSTSLVEANGYDHGKNQEASSFGGKTELGDAESESSGEGVEMMTSEADDTEIESTPFVSGRAISTTLRAESSVHSEGLNPAASDNFSHGPDQQFDALHVEEENTLEQALQVDIEASVEMPTGKMQKCVDHHLD